EVLRISSQVRKTPFIDFQKKISTKVKSNNEEVETKQLVFEGPNFRLIRILKIFSISTLGFAWTIGPFTWWNWDGPTIQAAELNGAILSLAFVASSAATITLHHFMSPYVTKIYLHNTPSIIPSTVTPLSKITLETLSIFSQPVQTTLQLKDLKPVMNRITLRWNIKNDYLINCEKNNFKLPYQTKFWIDNSSVRNEKEKEIL
ncbi:4279_t:CDS:2, partial [Funneliformis caledonium]